MRIIGKEIHNVNARNNISYKDIKVTNHAVERIRSRLGYMNNQEIKKLAANAKKNGINIVNITMNNCERAGFSKTVFNKIQESFPIKNNSTKIYLYKGYFFVFTGNHQRTLRSVIEFREKYDKGKEILSNANSFREAVLWEDEKEA